MKVEETTLKDCYILEPAIHEDERGFFFESFNKARFKELTALEVDFVQDNQSYSQKGVLRGLHYQKAPYTQAKLVRVLKGEVLDVVVDIRKGSETFGRHFSTILSENNKKQLFVPRGFAHGFVVLSATAEFFYKCDNFYHKASEDGIIYNDPQLGIDWQLGDDELIISEKDLQLKPIAEQ